MELVSIEDTTNSMLFERTAIAAKPEDEIIQTLQTTTITNIHSSHESITDRR